MYSTYLLAIVLFLGVDGGKLVARNSTSNDIIVFPVSFESERNFLIFADDLAMDPKQLKKLEIVLNNIATKYFGPMPAKLSLRAAEDGKTGLIHTIRMIGEAICNGIRNLFDKLGLPKSTGRRPSINYKLSDSTNLKLAVYYQLLRFPLELVPIYQSMTTQLIRHMQKHNYTNLGYKSVKFEFQSNRANSTEEWKFLAIFGTIGIYNSNINKCLDKKAPNSFDLKRAIGHLTNFPLEVTGKILGNRLGKNLPRFPGIKKAEYNQFHAFVCHGIANDSRVEYRNCLVEVKRIDGCVRTRLDNSSAAEDPVAKSSRDFFRAMKGLSDSCSDVDKEANISLVCKLKKKFTKSNEFPYIVDFFMGDLKKSAILERMAGEIGTSIKRNQVGSEVINEIASLIEMYKRGLEKKAKLLKTAGKDILQRQRYNRISDHLARFRRYCVDFANRTSGYLHGGIKRFGSVFVDRSWGIARENLTETAGALECWSEFVESIFRSWSINPKPFPMGPPVDRNNKTNTFSGSAKHHRLPDSINVLKEVGFMKSSHEELVNKLIESMKRLGQQRHSRRSSALVTLANTFLLATMFYESIAVLAAAIYRQDSGPMSPSNSAENEDRWPPRDRRSPSSPIDLTNLETQRKNDEQESLSLTDGTYTTTAGTLDSTSEGIEESVGNSPNIDAANDSIESTTISNRLFVAPP